MSNAKKLDSIQILRGIAALSVVMFHFRFLLVPEGANRTIPDALFGWGAIGVDLFFVISGFIMYYITSDKESGFKTTCDFIINRAIRIMPLYYIVLMFAFATGGAMSTFHYQEKIDNLISAMTFTPYLRDYAPLYILESGMLNVRWTLNYELYFYSALALCLLFRHRMILLFIWFIAPAVISFAVLSEVTVSTKGYDYDSVMMMFVTNPIILEFGMGIASGWAYKKINQTYRLKSIFLPVAMLLMVGMGIYLKKFTAYNLVSGIAFSVLVLVFALHNQTITRLFPKFMITLGNISFSLYLIHNPLMGFIHRKIDKAYPYAINNAFGFIAMIFIVLIVAYVSHRYIEMSLSGKLRKKFMSGHRENKPSDQIAI
ncbi:acyltransferase family protein [Trabulsiella odontotermitis]|uniref:acyltransferase family protein n=1 Tax=Trabulsiella odontotermitis TaxID=379893 RepID=UPI003AC04A26